MSPPRILGKEIGATGYGLMSFGLAKPPMSKDAIHANLKTALEHGANMWNGSDFYGPPDNNSLHLLRAYFDAYPEDYDKVLLCIKGGFFHAEDPPIKGDAATVRGIVDNALSVLGVSKIDLYEQARQDPNVPLAEPMNALKSLVDEGKLGGVCLSECSAKTIRDASAIMKIQMVEVEFSLFETTILRNGVGKACGELGIPIVAYSPVGRGFLTGQFQTADDIPEGDFRRMVTRFQGDNFANNRKLVDEVVRMAKTKSCTPAQLALSWIRQMGGRHGLPETIIPIPGTTKQERIVENCTHVQLSEEEMLELDALIDRIPMQGTRYPGKIEDLNFS